MITISGACRDLLFAEAAAAHPWECCGILTGDDDLITRALPARNVHPDPARQFEIDPRALIDAFKAERAGGLAVLGYYHSHPDGAARPSATDRRQAAGDGRIWAIVAGDEITFWRDDPDRFSPLSCTIAAG